MRLLSYSVTTALGSTPRVGAEAPDGRVLDLTLAFAAMLERTRNLDSRSAGAIAAAVLPERMIDFIGGGEFTLEHARQTLDWAQRSGDAEMAWELFSENNRLPVLPEPPLLRDFMAFEEHLKNIYPQLGREIPPEWYNLPVYYKGNPGHLGAHGAAVAIPDYCENFDFEFEFAAIIGRGGANIAPEEALDHIYGYTIYNDFSARDIQMREMSVGLGPAKGKDFDGAHVFGPVIVTRDEINDVYGLSMNARVNGRDWCTAYTGSMHWRFEDMIAHASRSETLRVGEIFGSGTAGGGSAAERGESLKRGDTVALTIEGIGTLENGIV